MQDNNFPFANITIEWKISEKINREYEKKMTLKLHFLYKKNLQNNNL